MARYEGQVPFLNNIFPMLTRYSRQSALVRVQDTATQEDQRDREPQPVPIYLENILPTSRGYRNILYRDLAKTNTLTEANFPVSTDTKYIFIRDSLDNVTQMWISQDKAAYYNAIDDTTHVITFPAVPTIGEEITFAYLKDQTYIFIPGSGAYVFDMGNGVFKAVALSGLDEERIKGIVAASGYLVAYDSDAIYFSSLIAPTDFVPSETTGAGSTKILGLGGAITGCLPIDNGFIIYTTGNMVAASYSGNSLLPFSFKELKGSAGVSALKYVAWNPAIPYHVAYTGTGLQQVDKNQAQHVFPEMTDFLTSGILETCLFDPATATFSEFTNTTGEFNVALNYVLNRYLVISYGRASLPYYTHALVFDMAIGRWGKVVINHTSAYAQADLGQFKIVTYLDLLAQAATWDTILAAGTIYLDWYKPSTITYNRDQILGFLTVPSGDSYAFQVVDTSIPADGSTAYTGFIVFGDYSLTKFRTVTLYESRPDTVYQFDTDPIAMVASYIKGVRYLSTPVKAIDVGTGNILRSRVVGEYFDYAIGGKCALDLTAFSVMLGRSNGRR